MLLIVDAPDTNLVRPEVFNVNAYQGGVPAGGVTVTITTGQGRVRTMAGCETDTEQPGNYDWSADRITVWALIGGAGGATWAIIELIGTTFGWQAALAVALAFVAGAGLGFWVGNGVEWFARLKEQNPRTITVSGNGSLRRQKYRYPSLVR